MSAVSRITALKEPPMSIKPKLTYESYPTTRVVNTFAENGATISRKHDLPFAPDSSDKERLVRAFAEFHDACSTSMLNIASPTRYSKAREILGGDLKMTWDVFIQSLPLVEKTDDLFIKNVRTYLRNFLPSNAFNIQLEYIQCTRMPRDVDCFHVASRLRLFNVLSVYLPGSGGERLFPTELSVKKAFFRVMLPQWRTKFEATGHLLEDPSFSLQRLINYMDQQRIYHDAVIARKNNDSRNNQGNNNSFMYYENDDQQDLQQEYENGFYNQDYTSTYDTYDSYHQEDTYDQYTSYDQYNNNDY